LIERFVPLYGDQSSTHNGLGVAQQLQQAGLVTPHFIETMNAQSTGGLPAGSWSKATAGTVQQIAGPNWNVAVQLVTNVPAVTAETTSATWNLVIVQVAGGGYQVDSLAVALSSNG